MAKINLLEKEAIELTIKYGYEGEELESAKFKKNGCLDGQRDKVTGEFKERGMVKFIRKLNSIYESVTVEGKGKKRIYILDGQRDEILEIEDKRRNNGTTDDDIVMSRYFFNRLIEMNTDKPKSTYQWAVDVGAYNPKTIPINAIDNLFSEIYYSQDLAYISNQFTNYFKNRNRAVTDMSLKRLKRDGLIDTIEHKMGKDENGEVEAITENEYKYYTSCKNEILKKYELTAFNYEHHLKKNDLLKNDIDILIKETGYQGVWIAYEVQLLSTERFVGANYQSFQEAYWNKAAMLINNLKAEENKLYSFANVYRKFNLASIIKRTGVKHELLDTMTGNKPNCLEINLIMHKRKQLGFTMPQKWIDEQNEFESMVGDVVTEKVKDKNVHDMTIDDIVDFSAIVVDTSESPNMGYHIDIEDTYRFMVYDTNNYNKTELSNAVDMIRNAFNEPIESQLYVGSF